VATRGQLRDLGPGLSHKTKVVQLWRWGLQFTQIEQRTGHSEAAIGRYLADFRQIAALPARGATVPEIRAVTGRSAALIAEYVGLYSGPPGVPRRPAPGGSARSWCEKGGAAVRAAPPHRLRTYRRLARRDLASLLRYKFLNEYGYDQGPVVVEAIVADLGQLIRGWVLRPGDLEPGQLVYPAPAASERPSKGKSIAQTKLLPVRLTLVASEDLEAIRAGRTTRQRRAIRVRRLAQEAHGQGALLSQTDLALLLGSSQRPSAPPWSACASTASCCHCAATWPTWVAGRPTSRPSSGCTCRGSPAPASPPGPATPSRRSTATSKALSGCGC
jgi:hypothetical protein